MDKEVPELNEDWQYHGDREKELLEFIKSNDVDGVRNMFNCDNPPNYHTKERGTEMGFLHYVAITNNVEIAKLLIKHCVDINQKDGNGKCPIDYAQAFEKKEVWDFFKSEYERRANMLSGLVKTLGIEKEVEAYKKNQGA